MPRLTISLPDNLHQCLATLASKNNVSLSNLINQLIQIGLYHRSNEINEIRENQAVEKYCHQLTIQMSALIKKLSTELLKLNREDFEKLQLAAASKYSEL
ncbi:Uncharacterised protein [Legionella busanensis]|uniref:CopG-like ribbon-helix-helix domain-containing protein n=1 Tax=Legionella busanensis TaxID=190655 RepID=A0A378JM93_9GAMM|nr:hypothetical protein [Legionella busanensis]STX52345.1 Uncharacterised protein [Legionella busanensis]